MRSDPALERGQDIFIIAAKYTAYRRAAIHNLESLNSYQNGILRRDGSEATVGETEEEVRELIREAIEFHLESLRNDSQPIPPPTAAVEYVDVPAA